MRDEYWLDPPDPGPDPEEISVQEDIVIVFDHEPITVDAKGNIEFAPGDLKWRDEALVDCENGDYSFTPYIDDDVVSLLEEVVPYDEGKYTLTGKLLLCYDIEVREWRTYYEDGYDVDDQEVEASLNFKSSDASGVTCDLAPVSIQSATFPTWNDLPNRRSSEVYRNHKVEPLGPSRGRGFFLHSEWNDPNEVRQWLAFYDGSDVDYFTATYYPSIHMWEVANNSDPESIVDSFPEGTSIDVLKHRLCELNENYAQTGDPITCATEFDKVGRDGKRYSYNRVDGYSVYLYEDGSISASKISPYDDASYFWAKSDVNGCNIYKDGRKVRDIELSGNTDADIERIVSTLKALNSNIQKIMIHN